jgi:uncharacterized protein YcbX/GNAT superfamily N-acetyltransferase
MRIKVGEITALFRYPVKSMAGERLDVADLGWHGLDGDRRLAFRRTGAEGGFPWLTASRLPELLLYAAQQRTPVVDGHLPTHVRTPDGEELPLFSQELAAEVGRRHGAPVEMMHLNRGIFDEASISVITECTVSEIARLAEQRPDVRRFRPNILMTSRVPVPFEEENWVGGVLSFGDEHSAAVAIVNRDERCSMVNLDPDSARTTPEVLKGIVRVRDNKAGVYGAVTRRGRLAVGQPIFFEAFGAHTRSRQLTHRLATLDDLGVLRRLMAASIAELQKPFLDAHQIESSRTIMGLDTQLIEDGTYYVVEIDGDVAGCGGWSRRATLYGGDATPGRSAELLDPSRDPARVRAMYTHPALARQGVGRLILSLCENAAQQEGFQTVELMATMAGEPFYLACGYQPVERVTDARGGAPVPLVRMQKVLG